MAVDVQMLKVGIW